MLIGYVAGAVSIVVARNLSRFVAAVVIGLQKLPPIVEDEPEGDRHLGRDRPVALRGLPDRDVAAARARARELRG